MRSKKKEATVAMDAFEHDALVLRSCNQDGTSHGGFQWPTVAGGMVEAPDWSSTQRCGNGLHGLLAGLGDWSLMKAPSDPKALWYALGVLRSEVVVINEQKVKFPRCRVLYVGHFGGAMDQISPAMTKEILRTVAERTKAAKVEPGGRSRNEGGAATASGDQGAATASGDQGAATASGRYCVALGAGPFAVGMVTESNLLVLVERDESGAILRHFAAMCETNGVEPGIYYRLTGGKLERVS